MTDLVERARIQIAQLTEESPQNRAERPSMAKAQITVLERLFGSSYPELFHEIEKTDRWQQLQRDSPLHPEEMENLVSEYEAKIT